MKKQAEMWGHVINEREIKENRSEAWNDEVRRCGGTRHCREGKPGNEAEMAKLRWC